MKTICMISTYNEAENIKDLVNEVLGLMDNIEILVVDDNSPDGTWKIVKEISNKRVHLLHRLGKKGRGYAGKEGLKWALDHNFDVVIEMDADFSHQPKYISRLVKGLDKSDMVLGSRRVKGGKDLRDEGWRRLLTVMANFYISVVLGVWVKDCNSGFRAYSRDALVKINVDKLFAKGPLIVQEILYRARLANLRITEVPIEFIEREKGKSKINFKRIMEAYFGVLKLRMMRLFGKI